MRDDIDRGCSPSGSRILTEWNLDASGFRAIITIQGAKRITAVSRRKSLFFCGARLSDFHGLLVNIDPECDLFHLWDLDAGLVEGFGTRFLDQSQGFVWVSSFGSSLKRVNPSEGAQLSWDLGFVAAGVAVMHDHTVMMPSSGTPSGQIHRLNPKRGHLTSWTLPSEQVPFSGVATPNGGFVFAERRLARIGRFDPRHSLLREWQLPDGSNPQVISRDGKGRIWFSDANFNNRIGRLDLRKNTVALFVKSGVVTFSVRPADRHRLGRLIAAADLASYLDLLVETEVPEVPAPVSETVLRPATRKLSPARSSIPTSRLVIPPTSHRVHPVDPPDLSRYRTPVVAPIDVVAHCGAIYATAGVFDERKGPSRLFRLGGAQVPDISDIHG